MKRYILILALIFVPLLSMGQSIIGQVRDIQGEPIPFADVILFQKADSTQLMGTVTNAEGRFELKVNDISNSFLKVSFVGYQTQLVENMNSPLQIILQPLILDEVQVTAERIKKDASSEVYYLTDSIRKGSVNTLQLLNKLHGIKVDWASDAVKIGEYRDVPIMVDGKEVNPEYARNLNPESIRKIEVLRYPKGKYGDVPIVVNLILNNSFVGIDCGAYTKGMLSLRNEQTYSMSEGASFAYSAKRWNVFGNAEAKNRNLLKATAYEQTFRSNQECTAAENFKNPNGSDKLVNKMMTIGMDYKINSQHVISWQNWIKKDKGRDKEAYNNVSGESWSSTNNDYSSSDFTTGVYYRGNIADELHLSSDLTYNYYTVDESKRYALQNDVSKVLYEGKKNFWRFNVDANYVYNEWLQSTIGYTFTRKDYSNHDKQSKALLFQTEENRNDAYFSVNINPTKNFDFVLGSNFLYVDEKNESLSDGNFSWMPLAKAFWQPFDFMSLNVNYYCDVQHPNLDQLSTVASQRNSILWHMGNPELRARVMHYMQWRIDFKNILQVTYLYKYSSREMTPWYKIDGDRVVETMSNGDYMHQYIGLTGDYSLPHHIGLNFAANYQSYKRRSTEERISWQNGHTWYLDVSASCQVHKNINILSEYFLRYDKVPRLQGEEYAQDEEWMLGANASMLKQKLTILLAFTIPTNAIPKRTYSKTMLPEYEYTTWSNEKVNNAIALLSIRYNIGKGKTSKSQNLNKSEAEKSF